MGELELSVGRSLPEELFPSSCPELTAKYPQDEKGTLHSMGHGYFTVVGFGIVVPVGLFLQRLNEHDLDESSGIIADSFDVGIHYEEQATPTNVFITTKYAPLKNAQGAGGSYVILDQNRLNQGHERLLRFLSDYFPEFPVQLTAYSYEGH